MALLLSIWVAAAPAVMAGRVVTDISPRAVEYVLDADQGSARDYHLVKGTVTVEYSDLSEARNTRLSVGLIDEQDQWVPLVAGTNHTTTFNPGVVLPGSPVTNTFDFALDPDQQLDPGQQYRIGASVEVYQQLTPQIGTWLPGLPVYGAPRRYFHFTNTADTDPEYNVLGVVESTSFDRPWRIDSVSDDGRNFRATFNLRLLRYDELADFPSGDTIPFQLRLSMVDDLGASIPVNYPNSGIHSFSTSLSTRTRSDEPSDTTRSVTVSFRPAEQLDSVNRRYALKAELWSRPAPGDPYGKISEYSGTPVLLLDFNGNLRFSFGGTGVTTVMTDASRSGTAVVIQPAYLGAYLDIAELRLTSGDATFTGSPGSLNLRLLASGLATYNLTPPVIMTNPDGNAPQTVAYGGLLYSIGHQISLSGSSATGTVSVQLPAGMGISTSGSPPGSGALLFSTISLGSGVVLNGQLAPWAAQTKDYGGDAWVMEETKPVAVRINSLTVQPETGRIDLVPTGQVNHPETEMRQQLADAPAGLPDRDKSSNSDYWLLASAVNTGEPAYVQQSPRDSSPGSNAALSAEFELDSGSFKSHFPEAIVSVGAAANPLVVQDDLVDTAESYLGSTTLSLSYLAGDPDASPTDCGGAATNTRSVSLQPTTTSARLQFTPTGGLTAPCSTTAAGGHELKWGFLGGSRYAFRTDAFQFIGFYMPGTFYPQGDFGSGADELAEQYTPIGIHTCGYVDGFWNFSDMEFSHTEEYRNNSLRADYAGINLRVANEAAGFLGYSIISDQDAGSYPLKSHCRYYARKSGVTGIHDAFGGPTEADLYGFPATFSSYGISFRDCRVVDSVTDGGLEVPYPSEFGVPLKQIRFTSTGRPLDAKLPAGIDPLKLKYWNCKMIPTALAFSSTDPCDASQGLMRIQAGVEMPNLDDTLYGELGFSADGEIAIDRDSGLSSRLKAPNHVAIRGPARPTPEGEPAEFETYTLTPVTDVYLNNHGDYPSPIPKGFLNLAGKLDVAFFRDLEVVVQTTAGVPGQEGTAPIHMMADWGGAFTDPENFDPTNRGFPAGSDPETYRSDPNYRPHALRSWMDAVDFDYPLQWDDATRAFRSPDDWDDSVDLLVLEANHRLEHLSAEEARLRFGLTYEGIPQIDLGGMLVNAVDEATGVLSAIEDALGNAAGVALYAGADAVAGLLNDEFDELFGPVVEDALTTPIAPAPNRSFVERQFLEQLSTGPGGLLPEGSLIPESEWAATLQNSFEDPTLGLKAELLKLGSQAQAQLPPTFVTEASNAIDQAIDALDVFVGPDGLLATRGGDYTLVGDLVFSLIDELAGEDLKRLLGIESGAPAFGAINAQVTAYVTKYAPSLNTIRVRLEQLKEQLEDVKASLQSGFELEEYIAQMFSSAGVGGGEFDLLVDAVIEDMIAHLDAQYSGSPEAFANQANRDATAEFLVRRVRDRLAAGAIAAGLQTVLREQLQDLQGAIDQTIGSVFSNINQVIREVIAEAAGALDDAVNPLNGALSEVAGAGSIDGYAVIRGDQLDHLRLDAKLELELDEPMTFQGYLEINQLQAGGPYGDAREIEIGAIDVPIEIFDTEADFTIIGRVILDNSDNLPVSLGGSIEMTHGQLEFESFKITELGAAMQFGISDNYFAAKLGMEFESFRVAGGLFVGHSNTIEPLELVDPDVAELITPPITGIYAYGEVFMPIVDLSCMFRVSAGLGIGAFYFTEGPTYGGKIYAAVEGEALCVVTVKGEVVMIGVKSDIFRFKGKGKVSGKVGWCPFCVKFKKSVSFTYDENNGFDADW